MITAPSRAGARPSGSSPTRTARPARPRTRAESGLRRGSRPPRAGASGSTRADPASIGRGRLVDVVAVEAEAGLEPQRIAGAEPDRLDLADRQAGRRQSAAAFAARPRSRSRPRPYSRSARHGTGARRSSAAGRHEGHAGCSPGASLASAASAPAGPAARAARGPPIANSLTPCRAAGPRYGRSRHPCVEALTTRNSRPSRAGSSGRVTIRSSRIPPFSSSSCV